jgi:hypothetical protein
MDECDLSVKAGWKWRVDWLPGLIPMDFFFYVGTPEGKTLRSPCQACQKCGKASGSCAAVDASVLRRVPENAV